ncbi:type IX secretion system membrane protein PorP/SprF [Flavobacterium sp. NKUCC04_CG]|uniref:PorP/SprF family type IX secretion system membrane protein n=1 Tax=Flavobacterium sp. NKUCC04_CG TaxID=2842121 RepID=UPI001C5ABAFF|nr:type IX secretion system membrane protein PorP/SprF [Flavobacterium sp. NKUCC04_CG]MBW3518210.1 type IX secretion system membrane protein PorP/SprF [Flavobacterium sp. NKUCC04_CG]
MKIFKKRYLALALIISQFSVAQEGMSVYSDYLSDNYYLIHPSMAGAANCGKLRLTARQQWSGQDDAPALQTLSFNTKVGEQSGIGVIAFNDRNGYHSQIGGKLSYAHHIQFSRSYYDLNMLSFGMSAGMVQTTLDQTKFGGFDPLITGGMEQKDSYFNVDFGASYQYFEFYTHFTVKNAIASKRDMYSDIESDNMRKYLWSAGYMFGTESRSGFSWEPSFMIQYTEDTREKAFDINMKVYQKLNFGQVWGGVSYRRNLEGAEYIKKESVATQRMQYITPIVGINYKNFMLAYTYTHLTGDVKFGNGGFHQLTLGINLFCKPSKYDCNCPAVNF